MINHIKSPTKIISPKVLLIRPPQLFYYGTWPIGPRLSVPTGLIAIASYLQKMGVDVSIYDSFVESNSSHKKEEIKKGRSTNFLVKWIKQFESTSSSFFKISEWISYMNRPDSDKKNKSQHFGASWDSLENKIKNSNADIIGITNLFRENTEETIKTLLNFCNLEWSEDYLKFYKNKRTFFTKNSFKVRQPIYNSSINNWGNYESYIGELMSHANHMNLV